ncbi:hypothetical protein PHJA_001731900 [Phtheirospermum japonicum]|uniref:Zeta toxin domain-containing protein n=1 Tax=Phtheirospermum japonicum TaxID=374723 RepID=A0A830C583_9LAMI|nr:hypothetical protein PHJA_001731900 [Phtheirospermum japonicum]
MYQDGFGKFILAHVAAVTSVGVISAASCISATVKPKPSKADTTLPRSWNARQMGFEDENECVQLIKLAHEYLKRSKGVDDKIFEYLANEPNAEDLYVNWFKNLRDAFLATWPFIELSLAPQMISQLIKLAHEYLKRSKGVDDKIFEYLANEPNAEDLYVKLVQEFERCILGYLAFHWSLAPQMISQVLSVDSEQKRLKNLVMAATRKQRFDKISKDLKVTRKFSTLVDEMKAIGAVTNGELNHSDVMAPVALSERCPVLLLMGGGMGAGKRAAANAVVVEADAFKETDGRDVIMDGTLSWEPFVEQTIAMARNVHKHRYRMGEGYKVSEDGTITENYWVQVDDEGEESVRKPYRIELVGVVCDAYLAVVRGIRRAIQIGRALIAWKDGDSKLLVDRDDIKCLTSVSELNDEAESIYDLYKDAGQVDEPGSVWKDIVMISTRTSLQLELKTAVKKIEITVA